MERRVHNEADAVDAAYGMIPKYEDLKVLFKETLNKEYTKEEYTEQFTVNVNACIAKIGRMEKIYSTINDTPQAMKDEMAAQRKRLEELKADKGEKINPFDLY